MSCEAARGSPVPPPPPRKNPTPTKICRQHLTPLQTLLQLGFPKARAEKALAATGHRGIQLASDWLVAHVNDPEVDRDAPRSYVAHLCPTSGPLVDQLRTFWDASRTQVGWNGAHAALPHVTLTPPLAARDCDAAVLAEAFSRLAADFAADFGTDALRVEKYASPNYLGLFFGKREEILLRSFCQALSEELSSSGCVLSALPPSPSAPDATGASPADGGATSLTKSSGYHLTMAFNFAPQHYGALSDLAAAVDASAPCDWELRLYSFEERLRGREVHRVLFARRPLEEDELELRIGDLVYVDPEELRASADGWVLGTSWLTGCMGYLPKNYVEQTAETNAWTLHFSASMSKRRRREEGPHEDAIVTQVEKPLLQSEVPMSPPSPQGSAGGVNEPASAEGTPREMPQSRKSSSSSRGGPRRLFVCRHGERIDFTFGTWIPFCFDEAGRYSQRDLNMPVQVPARQGGPDAFAKDSPLTAMGCVQARLVGEAMLAAGAEASVAYAYSSPSLRCVQTCHHILTGMGLQDKVTISLEPGLFEWLAWYQNAMPDWMTPEELSEAGFNVDLRYKPYISADELRDSPQESCEEYYTRNYFVTQCALQARESSGGNVLFVAHAASLDTCTRQVTGASPRPATEMVSLVRRVPYCAMAAMQEVRSPARGKSASGSQWRLTDPPVAPLTHCSNARWDWKLMKENGFSKNNIAQMEK